MKTTILANGVLRVTAENSIEAYALKQWWRGLGEIKASESTSGIAVDYNFREATLEAPLPVEQIK